MSADPADHGLSLRPAETSAPNLGGQPLPPDLPIQLLIDDDNAEGVFGFAGGTARQFLWMNRFDNPGPFFLEEIWVLFPDGADVPDDGAVQLAVFLDPDSDPTNGAELLATYDEVVQVSDGVTFSVFSLPAPLDIRGPGDVLIGVVNRFFQTGVDPPPTFPAAVDTTVPTGRSLFALWPGDVPATPDLATASVIEPLAGAAAGNFMIRGFGTIGPTVAIPVMGNAGAFMLIALLAIAGGWLVSRRN